MNFLDLGDISERYLEVINLIQSLRLAGYDVIVSVGEVEENYIGSNCGQYLRTHLQRRRGLEGGYTYAVRDYSSSC